jgi:hypothetical protein
VDIEQSEYGFYTVAVTVPVGIENKYPVGLTWKPIDRHRMQRIPRFQLPVIGAGVVIAVASVWGLSFPAR